jgi:hypothetical protein
MVKDRVGENDLEGIFRKGEAVGISNHSVPAKKGQETRRGIERHTVRVTQFG